MIIFTVVNFFDWLDEELDKRDWVRADLAKRAKISESGLSMAYSGKREIGQKMLVAIADALKISREEVFEAAGILQPRKDVSHLSAKKRQLLEMLENIDDDVLTDSVIAMLEVQLQQKQKQVPAGAKLKEAK